MNISERLTNTRLRLGWQPKEAAQKIGISPQFLGQIEKGQKYPSMKTLGKIAAAYGVSVETLVDSSGQIEPMPRVAQPRGTRRMRRYLGDISERGRAMLLSVAETVYRVDKEYESVGAKANVIGNVLGESFIDALLAELARLTIELGSAEAAIAELTRRISRNESGNNQR